MPLSVLHVSQPVDGGVARCVADLVADQVRRGWRVGVACPPAGELGELAARAGAELHSWRAGREPGPRVPTEVVRLGRVVRAASPDLVHLHSSKAGLAGRLAVRGRKPTIFQPHAWSFFALSEPLRSAAVTWERLGARWTHATVCVSEGELAAAESAGIRAAWRVIPNGIDVEAFSNDSDEERSEARRRLEVQAELLVVCIGRLSRQKGQDVLLEAWGDVEGRVPQAELVLVGDGPAAAALRRQAGSARIVGDRNDVRDWLRAADLVVLPSRWEGLAYTVLEAMAAGRSVVTTDVPGMKEALGDSGAVVRPEDPRALAEAIVGRLRDPMRRAADGEIGRERALRLYDVQRSTAEMADLYEEVVARRTRQ